MQVHFEHSPRRRAVPVTSPAAQVARRRAPARRRPRDVGGLVEHLYAHYLELYGDPELAQVATATRVTEALIAARTPEMARRAA